jgi:hypothetical protein
MRTPLRWLSAHYLNRPRTLLAVILALATLLELAAGTGLAYVAGFGRVRAALAGFHPVWLAVLFGALVVSFAGYYFAYRGIFRVEGGPALPARQMWAVVAAGFGGFLSHGGGALDRYALEAAGADREEARVRATGLGGMEQGVLAIGGTVAAIAVLVSGLARPNPSYTLPWAVIPLPGFLLAFWLAERYRGRCGDTAGWRRGLGRFLRSIHIIRALFAHPLRWGWAVAGMALFWAADAVAAWAGLAAFGFQMNLAALFVGFATGMLFTRRTGPLAGAGVLALLLPLTLWASGAPFAVAVVGVFTYRLLVLWLPSPLSAAAVPTLRGMGRRLMRERREMGPRPKPWPLPAGPVAEPAPVTAPPAIPASPGTGAPHRQTPAPS